VNSRPSPLGRYDDGSGSDQTLHEVCLIGVPVQVLVAARQHHDDLMREFGVLAVSEQDLRDSVPERLVALTEILGSRYGATASRPDSLVDEAAQRGEHTLDLIYQVPEDVVGAADRLETLMAEADEFCRTEQMLTLPRPSLLMQFARWYLDEFRRQIGGQPPQPWTGPLSG
jgi:hypothetical protein